ncbi:MAG: DUF4386 domain-containing protein [Pseudomonadota bacterium]
MHIQNPKAYAHFAGFNYLLIFALAIYANFFVFSELIVASDPAATASNIAEQEFLFRIATAFMILVLIADIFIAWAFFLLLRPVNQPLSLLMALFRLSYTVAQIGVVLNLSKALTLAGNASLAPSGLSAHLFAAAHGAEFTITLILFGIHLLLLGYLIVRAPFLPAVIGVLVSVAGLGYIIDGFAAILFDGYGPLGSIGLYIVVLPALAGEGALMLWLLLRGINQRKWREIYS